MAVALLSVPMFIQPVSGASITTLDEGLRAYRRGAFDEAAAKWQKAVEEYRRQGNIPAQLRRMTDLATAHQALGQQRHAVQILEEAVRLAEESGDRHSRTLTTSRLGAALLLTFQLERAEPLLRKSLESARAVADSQMAAAILNEIGNLLAAQQKPAEALTAFLESADLARKNDPLLAAQALCNAASTAGRAAMFDRTEGLNTDALKAIEDLEASHDKAVLLITAAQTDRKTQTEDVEASRRLTLRARQSYLEALEAAEAIGDRRAAS